MFYFFFKFMHQSDIRNMKLNHAILFLTASYQRTDVRS